MKGTDKRNEMDYLVRAWFFMNWEGRYTGLKEIFMGLAIDQFVGGSQSGLGSYKLLVDWVTNLHVIYIFSILQSAYLFVSLFLFFFFWRFIFDFCFYRWYFGMLISEEGKSAACVVSKF